MTLIEIRRKEAKERQVIYDGMTVDQKLQRISQRPGKSLREMEKLLKVKITVTEVK